jgi:HAMP domain-containing protein
MNTKVMVYAAVILFFCIALTVALRAQGTTEDPLERLKSLEMKLDSLKISHENAQAQIQRKLDQVLANQQSLLREIEIVKIRATR